MALDRRELLKFFGIGATITPVLNGHPVIEVAAKLLSEPQVQPIVVTDKFPDGHEGENFRNRLRWNPYEAIWLKFWQIENNPPTFLNSGIGPLEHILQREPTEVEKAAVAGVIQWFGSNCGHSFIAETLEACGCRVNWDWDSTRARDIQRLQHYGIWPEQPGEPRKLEIKRHYRNITLAVGEYPKP